MYDTLEELRKNIEEIGVEKCSHIVNILSFEYTEQFFF